LARLVVAVPPLPADYQAIAFATAFIARISIPEPGGLCRPGKVSEFFVQALKLIGPDSLIADLPNRTFTSLGGAPWCASETRSHQLRRLMPRFAWPASVAAAKRFAIAPLPV
jgi:hypothetical protein